MFDIPIQTLLTGLLIFLRIGALFTVLPVFGDTPTPVRTRVLLSVSMTIALWPAIPSTYEIIVPLDLIPFVVVALKEMLVGLILGFVSRLVFDGIVMSASFVGYQMGFGTANLMLPDAGIQADSFTAFHRILAFLFFFALNLHHIFFSALMETFRQIPAGAVEPSAQAGALIIGLSASIFVTAMQLAAPVLIGLMFATAALGLIARTVPQLNVFTLSFPVNFFIGLLIYVASLPFFPGWIDSHFANHHEILMQLINGIRPA